MLYYPGSDGYSPYYQPRRRTRRRQPGYMDMAMAMDPRIYRNIHAANQDEIAMQRLSDARSVAQDRTQQQYDVASIRAENEALKARMGYMEAAEKMRSEEAIAAGKRPADELRAAAEFQASSPVNPKNLDPVDYVAAGVPPSVNVRDDSRAPGWMLANPSDEQFDEAEAYLSRGRLDLMPTPSGAEVFPYTKPVPNPDFLEGVRGLKPLPAGYAKPQFDLSSVPQDQLDAFREQGGGVSGTGFRYDKPPDYYSTAVAIAKDDPSWVNLDEGGRVAMINRIETQLRQGKKNTLGSMAGSVIDSVSKLATMGGGARPQPALAAAATPAPTPGSSEQELRQQLKARGYSQEKIDSLINSYKAQGKL